MQLYHTPNSPYARRARLAVREAGLLGRVEEIDLHPREENLARLLAVAPAGKVPVLVTDGGAALCESLVIAHHLDDVSGGKLYPRDPAARERALEVEGLASALMDSLFVRSREKRRPQAEQSPGVIELEAERAVRLYDALAARVAVLSADAPDMASLTTAAALGYADGRHPDDGWRDGRAALASWFAAIMKRPALAETVPAF
ncbi:MAG: glutathione S-transferase family protein [Ectothiorhodospiraceae bacterium]|nr:glutathione S-transferase family protein [Chromatiales bacterium]MCP5153704.1 glutathione S-transferase family protein [Ectothiorhodospiraceae bacterium]